MLIPIRSLTSATAGCWAMNRRNVACICESGAHRAFGVVLVRDRRAEQRHDRVTEHLVDPPAEALDVGHQAFERGVDEAFDLFRVTELGERRESRPCRRTGR